MIARIQVVQPAVAALLLVMGLTMQACNDDSTTPTPVPPGPPTQQLVVDPSNANILVGESIQFHVTGAGIQSGGVIEWSSSDPQVVMVSADGLATGVGLGSAILSAARGGFAATALVSVSGRRQPIQAKRRVEPN